MIKIRMKLAELLRFIVINLPRGQYLACRILLGKDFLNYSTDETIRNLAIKRNRVFFDKHLDCYVVVDLANWAGRSHFFTGSYFEKDLPLFIRSYLTPADTFIDIGANRGIHTMCAATHLRKGWVYGFEPHPRTYKILEMHTTLNQLNNVTLFNMGLADEASTLTLNEFSDIHSGLASFRESAANAACGYSVPVNRLDDLLERMPIQGACLVKVDTEGFDHRVIKGMGKLLAKHGVMIWTEVTDEWLKNTGSSALELFTHMRDFGYRAFLPKMIFKSFIIPQLTFQELELPLDKFQYDVLFAKSDPTHPPKLS